jgi:hypothetical protein
MAKHDAISKESAQFFYRRGECGRNRLHSHKFRLFIILMLRYLSLLYDTHSYPYSTILIPTYLFSSHNISHCDFLTVKSLQPLLYLSILSFSSFKPSQLVTPFLRVSDVSPVSDKGVPEQIFSYLIAC